MCDRLRSRSCPCVYRDWDSGARLDACTVEGRQIERRNRRLVELFLPHVSEHSSQFSLSNIVDIDSGQTGQGAISSRFLRRRVVVVAVS